MDKKKEIIPGWEVVEQLGSGGFSTVYKIKKTSGEFYAALKVIKIPASSEEYKNYLADGYDENTISQIFENQVKKYEEEFHLMSLLKGNTNIVSYEDHMIVQGDDGRSWSIFIRMELLETLTNKCISSPPTLAETVKAGVDICRALELCARENIIHRDIKPQNIFVNRFGDYKLGDFGIARTMDHTTHATKIGTFTYIAPEVYKGEKYNADVDIYSLGLVLYWLLNERRLPFVPLPPAVPSPSAMSEAVAKRLSGETLPAPKNGSENLKQIVLKACAFNGKDRYQSATQMRMELERELYAIADSVEQTLTASETVKQAPTSSETVKQAPIDATVELGGGKSPDMSSKQVDSSDFGGDRTVPIASPLDLGNSESGKSYSKSEQGGKPTTESKTIKSSKTEADNKTATAENVTDSKTDSTGKPKKKKKKIILKILIILFALCAIGAIVYFGFIRGKYYMGWSMMASLSNGTLTISGKGDMPDFSNSDDVPWYNEMDKITKVVIKDGVTSIGDKAFSCCYSLESITIGDSVTSIGDWAFADYESLESVTIGGSVTSIGECAFASCSSLESVTIGDSVTNIGNRAFSFCYSLENVTMGNSVTSIGEDAFFYCNSLASVTFGNSLTSIGNGAFSCCNSLENVTMGNSVTSIGEESFFNCTSLASITIPDSVTSIGHNAFDYCDSLKSVTIGDSVTSIGDWAFANCDSLESITIPDSVTSIGEYAFEFCNSLTSVTFKYPNGWYVTSSKGATSGTNVTVTDKSTAADYLTDTYDSYYWYKK